MYLVRLSGELETWRLPSPCWMRCESTRLHFCTKFWIFLCSTIVLTTTVQVPVTHHTFSFLLQGCVSDRRAGFRHALLAWRAMRRKKVVKQGSNNISSSYNDRFGPGFITTT